MAACFAAGDAPATRAEVAHQVARILIGRVNFHVHDGLEKRWTRLLHGFLESQRTGNLERDIGRIHVVVFAVVEDSAEIGDRESVPGFGIALYEVFQRQRPAAFRVGRSCRAGAHPWLRRAFDGRRSERRHVEADDRQHVGRPAPRGGDDAVRRSRADRRRE